VPGRIPERRGPRGRGPLRAFIDSLDAEGHGLASVHGHAVAVPGTLPGELVEIAPPANPRGEARLTRVLEPSADRVQPPCAHVQDCGGCTWQHVSYSEQLRLKRERVQYLLDATLGRASVRVAPAVPTPCKDGETRPWRFRHKVHFAFDAGADGGVVMGHLARGTHRVVDVDDCPVHAEAGDVVAREVKRVLASERAACGPPPTGQFRHFVARVGRAGGEVLATLVVTRDDERVRRVAERVLASRCAPAGLSINIHPDPGPMLFGPETIHLAGRRQIEEQVAGARFLISATSFFQTNLAAADVLLDIVLKALPGEPSPVLDLYAGLGLFAIPAAVRGHAVLAIEESPAAAADGLESARLNGVADRCRFVRSKVEYAIARLKNRQPRFDVAILDPPRSGAPSSVLRRVRDELSPRRVLYVSCDPESLARDLDALIHRPGGPGYRLTRVVPIDMFPHTTHVESVAILDRVTAPR
jgi:23S rRNA (uracil1939-C5)-methyltransferase